MDILLLSSPLHQTEFMTSPIHQPNFHPVTSRDMSCRMNSIASRHELGSVQVVKSGPVQVQNTSGVCTCELRVFRGGYQHYAVLEAARATPCARTQLGFINLRHCHLQLQTSPAKIVLRRRDCDTEPLTLVFSHDIYDWYIALGGQSCHQNEASPLCPMMDTSTKSRSSKHTDCQDPNSLKGKPIRANNLNCIESLTVHSLCDYDSLQTTLPLVPELDEEAVCDSDSDCIDMLPTLAEEDELDLNLH